MLTLLPIVVGCKFSDKIIYPETFANNPDSYDEVYSTDYGIYKPHCGLDNVMLSWGHDEVSLCSLIGPTTTNQNLHSTYIMSSKVNASFLTRLLL